MLSLLIFGKGWMQVGGILLYAFLVSLGVTITIKIWLHAVFYSLQKLRLCPHTPRPR